MKTGRLLVLILSIFILSSCAYSGPSVDGVSTNTDKENANLSKNKILEIAGNVDEIQVLKRRQLTGRGPGLRVCKLKSAKSQKQPGGH